jgi:hypothetical protein
MLRGVSGDLRKATSALVSFSKGSGPTAEEERASGRAGTETKAAISLDFLAVIAAER